MGFLKCAAVSAFAFFALLLLSALISAADDIAGLIGVGVVVFFATPIMSWANDKLFARFDREDVSRIVYSILMMFAILYATSCSSDVRRQFEVIDAVDAMPMACPFECEPHQVCCDTEDGVRCTDVLAEPDNCGSCGVWCGVGGYCNDGVCR